jgi:subtilisin family serine protease
VATLPGVKAVFPVVPIRHPRFVEPSAGNRPDMASALGMTGVDIAQNSLGLTGAGVRIGIIDSGIDYDHPDLGGCFGPGCKVAYGYDFVGDDFDWDTPGSLPQPDDDPDDCSSHGTAVAGIVGASGQVKGVAPGATLGAYRVFGCTGDTSPELIIEAMEKALDDGMQVVNLSIGAPFEWPEYPTAKAANELVRNGVVVVASVGNNGQAGLFAAGASGVGKRVIGVASFDNLAITQPAFTLSPDDEAVGFNPIYGSPLPPAVGSLPLARTGTTTTSDDACSALPAGSLTGKATLIRRGTCTAYTKALHAMNAGAAAVVIYNDAAGQYYPNVYPVGSNPPIAIPVVTISAASGALMDGRIASGPTTLTWTSQTASTPLSTAGRVSDFSSWGLAHDLTVKPDIGAPGRAIYTTLTIEDGRHGTTSGTSMASPHVAGAAALLLEARPGLRASTVRDILQNHAQPGAWSGDSTGNTPDCVHRQGAGLLQIDAAITGDLTVSPARIATGESQAGPFTQRLSIVNHGPKPLFVDLSHVAAASTSGSSWNPTIASGKGASVAFSKETLFLGVGRPVSVSVTITANPTLADGSIYGGYVVFTPRGGAGTVRVPYAGFKGDYQAIPILTPIGYDLPWLARVEGNNITPFPNGETFTLEGNDIPTLFVHYDHAVRKLRIDAYEAVGQKWVGSVVHADYVARSASANSATDYPWDGTVVFRRKVREVPNGVYVLKLSVLKPLGDSRVANDWETWTSPAITLARP